MCDRSVGLPARRALRVQAPRRSCFFGQAYGGGNGGANEMRTVEGGDQGRLSANTTRAVRVR
jgi:hypothetical protein